MTDTNTDDTTASTEADTPAQPVELITGHTGTAHVTSTDMVGLYQAVFGVGTLRLPLVKTPNTDSNDVRPGLAVSSITWPVCTYSGGKLTIPAGMWLMSGRLVKVSSQFSIDVPTHTSADCVDNVYFEFTRNAQGIESVSVGVYKGVENSTAYTGTPYPVARSWPQPLVADDAGYSHYTDAFCRLKWTKSSAAPQVDMDGSRIFPAGYTYYQRWSMWGGTVDFVQVGPVCTLHFYAVHKGGGSWDMVESDKLLPEWSRPPLERSVSAYANNGNSENSYFTVYPDGHFRLGNCGSTGTSDATYGTITWTVW